MSEILGLKSSPATPASGTPADGLVKDGSMETFEADVIAASMTTPVIVDFWATWCGPCRTLTPMLEKAANAARGAVRLVKIDIDKNQMLASQLRIQSVPTVYAFFQGRPVDGFQGAIPESEIKAFVGRLVELAGGAGAGQGPEDVVKAAEAALAEGDAAAAAEAFAAVLGATQPGDAVHAKALGGLARCHLALNDLERARQIFDSIPEAMRDDPALAPVAAALALAGSGAGDLAAARARAEAAPGDPEAQFALAEALLGAGEMEAGVEALLDMVAADREWNESAARRKLLTAFEALGPAHPVTARGRRRLSSILFS